MKTEYEKDLKHNKKRKNQMFQRITFRRIQRRLKIESVQHDEFLVQKDNETRQETDEPTWRCPQNPFIGALGIQEPCDRNQRKTKACDSKWRNGSISKRQPMARSKLLNSRFLFLLKDEQAVRSLFFVEQCLDPFAFLFVQGWR